MPEVKADLNIDLSRIKEDLEDVTGSVEELFSLFGERKDEFVRQSEEMSDAFKKGVSQGLSDIQQEQATASEGLLASINKVFDVYDDRIKDLKQKGGFARLAGEMAPQQMAGVEQGLTKLKGSILSELPFGGLIGLMMLGSMREEEVRAMGSRTARMFQQTGDVASEQMARVGTMTRRLGVELGKGPMGLEGHVSAAAAAFAQAGVDIETVLDQKFNRPIRHSSGSILETSVALDNLFKQASGTAARQMSVMIRDFNLSASESATVVAQIGLAARESGTSVEAFSSSVMRSAQSLRTQRVDISEVAEAQLKFQKIMSETPGVTKQFAAGYAETGVAQITQGISGMSVGLSAVLGERMSARGVGGEGQVTGLEAYYAMREGFGGKGQTTGEAGMFEETVTELLSLAQENGRTVEEQRFFLEKMGMGFEGAKVLTTIGKEASESKDLQGAINRHQKELRDSFVDARTETSNFQKALLKIQDGIAKIGMGVLGSIIAGFDTMRHAIMYGIGKLTKEDEEKQKARIDAMNDAIQRSTRSTAYLSEGVKEIGEGAGEAFRTIFPGKSLRERELEEYRKAGKAAEYGGEMMSIEKAKRRKEEDIEDWKEDALEEFRGRLRTTLGSKLEYKGYGDRGGMRVAENPIAQKLLETMRTQGAEAADKQLAEMRKQRVPEAMKLYPGMAQEMMEATSGGRRFEIKIIDKGPSNTGAAEGR